MRALVVCGGVPGNGRRCLARLGRCYHKCIVCVVLCFAKEVVNVACCVSGCGRRRVKSNW